MHRLTDTRCVQLQRPLAPAEFTAAHPAELYFCRSAFSLVELLVVVAVIGTLVAMLLPAIQAARERARRAICTSHLRQIGIAVHAHLEAHKHFPTGGWGANWTGDPNRGFGKDQPGGWVFNILPYLEQTALHDMSRGTSGESYLALQAQRMATPIEILNCPTRRAAKPYPNLWRYTMTNADSTSVVARGDYAASVGGGSEPNKLSKSGEGPKDLAAVETYSFPSPKGFTGVTFARSTVRSGQIVDGFTTTYLIGEKYLNPEVYETGIDPADRGHLLAGHSPDNLRRASADAKPKQDSFPISLDVPFGSAHFDNMNFLFCDGSVRPVSYSIAADLHAALGNRRDAAPVNADVP